MLQSHLLVSFLPCWACTRRPRPRWPWTPTPTAIPSARTFMASTSVTDDGLLASMMRIPVRPLRAATTPPATTGRSSVKNNTAADDIREWLRELQTSALPNGSSFDRSTTANLHGRHSEPRHHLPDGLDAQSQPASAASASRNTARSKPTDPYNPGLRQWRAGSNGNQIVNDSNDAYEPVTATYPQQWVQLPHEPTTARRTRAGCVCGAWTTSRNGGTASRRYLPAGRHLRRHAGAQPEVGAGGEGRGSHRAGHRPGARGLVGIFFSRADMDSGWGTASLSILGQSDRSEGARRRALGCVLPAADEPVRAAHGYRLLDVLDIHGYIAPDTLNPVSQHALPATRRMETLRMTSTRAFWDPNYIVPNASPGDNEYDANGNQVGAPTDPAHAPVGGPELSRHQAGHHRI